ncbi:hypothetical protein EVAR_38456_1 [Eumeta japonica]|uniref:Uncharacterized protein n=1 Tax=Eumeta variegata TaxID=151549 RepID=A0A4C1WN74_EUMVA|nr:hypothetical protein EVAR_38456_1 [Eumeta japonica]
MHATQGLAQNGQSVWDSAWRVRYSAANRKLIDMFRKTSGEHEVARMLRAAAARLRTSPSTRAARRASRRPAIAAAPHARR